MLGLAKYEAGICDCGFHESLASDPSNVFEPGHRTCRVCGGVDAYIRMWSEHDKQTPDNLPARRRRDSDGRKIYMKLKSPQEAAEWLASRGRSAGGDPR